MKGAMQGWRQGAASFLLVNSGAPFPQLRNVLLLSRRTRRSQECVLAEETTATVAPSDCRLLHLLAAVLQEALQLETG